MKKSVSELRQDTVSGDWVVIATGRARRPHDFVREKRVPFLQPKNACPFEKSFADARAAYARDGAQKQSDWWVQAIPNKYPAFDAGVCAVFRARGPYVATDGVGAHEVVITRDHTRSFALMSDEEADLVVRAYQDRLRSLADDPCVEYISLFHNHGRLAGATISHPHSQIIALPVVPPDVASSLEGSGRYFEREKKCVHCVMLAYDRRENKRIIFESARFIALVPFASRTAFEIRIFPKSHRARFEDMAPEEHTDFAHTLRVTLAKLYKGLKNPDYNFFLHTAPVKRRPSSEHYHWHFEILPKTAIWAGFEIGTGIEISVIAPEDASAFLKKIKP